MAEIVIAARNEIDEAVSQINLIFANNVAPEAHALLLAVRNHLILAADILDGAADPTPVVPEPPSTPKKPRWWRK